MNLLVLIAGINVCEINARNKQAGTTFLYPPFPFNPPLIQLLATTQPSEVRTRRVSDTICCLCASWPSAVVEQIPTDYK